MSSALLIERFTIIPLKGESRDRRWGYEISEMISEMIDVFFQTFCCSTRSAYRVCISVGALAIGFGMKMTSNKETRQLLLNREVEKAAQRKIHIYVERALRYVRGT